MNIYTEIAVFVMLIGVVFTGMFTIATSLGDESHYNANIDDSYSEKYADLTDIEEYDSIKNDLKGISSNKESQYFTGTWDGIKKSISLIYTSFENGFKSITYIGDDAKSNGLPIPSYIIGIAYVCLALVLVGLILTILLKVQ